MAIEFLQGPATENAGLFNLPLGFDRKRYAAKWVKVGPEVNAAAEREHIIGTTLTADGWTVWKEGPVGAKMHKVATSKGEYILLCRPLDVQQAVNAIYGNVGKERMIQEKRGETTGGVPLSDPGILNEERLTRVLGPEGDDGGDVKMNPVPRVVRVEQTPQELHED